MAHASKLTEEQKRKINEILLEAGVEMPGMVGVYGAEGYMEQFSIVKPKPPADSFVARRQEVLDCLTERKPLPTYAGRGNNHGDVYIHYRSGDGRMVYGSLDFEDVIEAIARRVVLKGSQVL